MPGPAHVFATIVEKFVLRRQGVFPRRHFENSSPRRLLLSGSPALKTPKSVNLEDYYGQVYLMSRRDEGQGIIACFIPCSLDPAGGKLLVVPCWPGPNPLSHPSFVQLRGGQHLPNLRWGAEILQCGRVDSHRVCRAIAQFSSKSVCTCRDTRGYY